MPSQPLGQLLPLYSALLLGFTFGSFLSERTQAPLIQALTLLLTKATFPARLKEVCTHKEVKSWHLRAEEH